MEQIDKKISKFIKQNHILTLSTSQNNSSWCCSCFYAYNVENNTFIISSDSDTQHIKNIENNNKVSANIYLNTKIVGKIKGLQVQGIITKLEDDSLKNAKIKYLKKYPFAAFVKITLWAIEPNYFKYTDNKLGFGKKIIWTN